MKILTDLKHKARCYYEKDDAVSVFRVFISDGSCAMVLFRITSFLQKIGLGIIGIIFMYLNKTLNGCVIGRHAQFDEGFVIMHPVGIVINGAVKGGKNIVVESGVVIGAARNGLPVKAPRLGNNIFIGSGAKILGDIAIGNNVTIGANAVVVKNVPDNKTAVGVPARLIGE